MWGISITMCYFHRFIDDINYSLQDFLITFFELLAWIVLIIGAIDTFPQNKYSNKRVWFYYAIMGGFISAIHSFIGTAVFSSTCVGRRHICAQTFRKSIYISINCQ